MRVLVIPNYTNFGQVKDINRDSFLLVFKSFLDNTQIGNDWELLLASGAPRFTFMKEAHRRI